MLTNNPILVLWKNRQLAWTLVCRDVAARYKGSWLGVLWSFITPMLMLGIYTLVFGAIFRARWDQGAGSTEEFAVILFAGLLIFNFFSESVLRSPSLIIANPSYVKKIVFPLELQPWVVVGSALFGMMLNLLVLFIAQLVLIGPPPITALLIPLIVLPLVFWVSGLIWLISALGVFFRDIGQVLSLIVTAMMFLSPLFYSAHAVPESFQFLVNWNPLSFIIEGTRGVLIFGQLPDLKAWLIYMVLSILIMQTGYQFFLKLKNGFADVL